MQEQELVLQYPKILTVSIQSPQANLLIWFLSTLFLIILIFLLVHATLE